MRYCLFKKKSIEEKAKEARILQEDTYALANLRQGQDFLRRQYMHY